jgi:hypothetical protein
MTTFPSLLSLAAALALVGCVDHPETTTTTTALVAPTLERFITEAENIGRTNGYNEVYDKGYSSCFKACAPDNLNLPDTSDDDTHLRVSFVSSAADIAKSQLFTLDANLEVALLMGNIKANASMRLASQSNFSRKAVRMLLVATRTFKVTRNQTLELDPAVIDPALLKRSAATSDADFDNRLRRFMARCGHIYAKEELRGAYLFALYEFTSTDQSKLDKLELALGAAFKSRTGTIEGGVETTAQTQLNQALSEVRWTVDVIAKGFKVNGTDGEAEGKIELKGDGQGGLDLQRIVKFFDAMQKSVGADMQAIVDGNGGHPVSVHTLGLTAGYYPDLPGVAPGESELATVRMSDIQATHERMLHTYGALAAGVMRARDEIAHFMNEGEHQEERQIMKWPGKPYTPAVQLRSDDKTGLVDRVEVYDRAFSPDNDTGAGAVLVRRILDCWRRGRSGALTYCLPAAAQIPDPAAADSMAAAAKAAKDHLSFKGALEALTAFNDTARPTALRCGFVQAPKTFTWAAGKVACGSNRYPTETEAYAMGLIAHYRSARNYNGRTSFWVDDQDCNVAKGWPYSALRNVSGSATDWWCADGNWTEPTICVDPGGLFPTSMPKLYPPGNF